jgi:hypothetical protein
MEINPDFNYKLQGAMPEDNVYHNSIRQFTYMGFAATYLRQQGKKGINSKVFPLSMHM